MWNNAFHDFLLNYLKIGNSKAEMLSVIYVLQNIGLDSLV